MKPPLDITCQSRTPFAAALSLFTEVGSQLEVLQAGYPVVLDGQEYKSAGEAYCQLGKGLECEELFELLLKIITAKLEQHELLPPVIALSGGVEWLRTCSYESSIEPVSFWSGTGYNSAYITALIVAYRQVNRQLLTERGMKEEETIADDTFADPAFESVNSDRQSLSKLVSYNAVSQELYVSFDNREKALKWLKHLKALGIGGGYSIEESLKQDWRFELAISMVSEDVATKLNGATRFDLSPHRDNPRQLSNSELMPTAVAEK